MRTVLDEVFLRRFIYPSQWAGIAVLIICLALAAWKALRADSTDEASRQNLTWLGKLIARFFD